MTEEYLYEVDWNDTVVGIIQKKEMRERNAIHRVALIIPRTKEKKFVIARRAKEKHPFPDVWVCAIGGKVRAGESYEEAALREMQEEANIQAPLKAVTVVKMDSDRERAIYRLFTSTHPVDMKSLQPDPSEVQYFQAFFLEEIKQMIEHNGEEFAPSFKLAMIEFEKAMRTEKQ